MNIQKFYQEKISDLKTAQIPNAESEAREIFEFVLKKDWAFLLAHPEKQVPEKQVREINKLIRRRLNNEPLAYILGYKNFYGLDFIVNKDVLIPRPETEMMVEKVLILLKKELRNKLRNKIITYIDIGTGSGCIPISTLKNLSPLLRKHARRIGGEGVREWLINNRIDIIATDISLTALKTAKKNAEKHKVSNQIKFIQESLLSPFLKGGLPVPPSFSEGRRERLEISKNYQSPVTSHQLIITANLPYLSENLYQSTQVSVKDYEPKQALLSGQDGLDHYRKLLDQIKTLRSSPLCKGKLEAVINDSKNYSSQNVNKGGKFSAFTSYQLFLEISPEQKDLIKKEILKRFPKAKISFHKDLAGKCRLVEIAIF